MGFPLISGLGDAVKGLFSLAKAPIDGWQERKTLKTQAEIANQEVANTVLLKRADAEVHLAKLGIAAETEYDLTALQNMKNTWKDEYLVVLLFLPVLMLFISPLVQPWFPDFQETIISSVVALDKFPAWYTWLLSGIVIATFGLRWYFNKRK